MIARIFIPILLMIVMPDFYFDVCCMRSKLRNCWWKRLLWWLPTICMVAYTIGLASLKNFAPDDLGWLNVYLFLVGIIVLPKFCFALCSALGLGWCHLRHVNRNYGNVVGLIAVLFVVYVVVYGSTAGFRKLEVRHVDLYFADLPKVFEGYRIVQFSDVHVGTYTGSRQAILQRAIDTINAQRADMIVFTGDLQNMQPSEIYAHRSLLSSIKASDGVYSILGNHDYAQYIRDNQRKRAANEHETQSLERQLGWTLLMNEHRIVRRGNDSIVVAGEENDGKPPFPQRSDVAKTLHGVGKGAFIVMLQHDPTGWRRHILPQSKAQLTLSGHTHNAQFSIFGWSPSQWIYRESCGLYVEGRRMLYVSAGLGGFVPFRFGASGEIVVITLHKSKDK